MARTTRSATQHQEKDTKDLPPRNKAASKKRKRTSLAENEDQPAAKQLRSDNDSALSIKEEEGSQEPENAASGSSLKETTSPQLPHAGEVPINPSDAQKILDILEMIDTQGLLDRVFPLPASSSVSSSQTSHVSYSFRTLLKESSQHPLSVLRSAVEHLFPISSHPRSRPSTPAAQQLRFCALALSLLDQASFHSVSVPLDIESIFSPDSTAPSTLTPGPDDVLDVKPPVPTPQSPPARKRKYALVQKLSTGDWWTSLNSDFSLPSADKRDLTSLPTAHADLVAILPTPAADTDIDPALTLGSYSTKKPPGPIKNALPSGRRVSCGTFLDYGAYASFAPSFDQDGMEIGREQLGEVIYGWEMRRKEREKGWWGRGIGEASGSGTIVEVEEDEKEVEVEKVTGPVELSSQNEIVAVDESLEGLFSAETVADIKSALGNLELENAVQELLERNRKALIRLEQLQLLRLKKENGGSSTVEEGSEEWDTAQGIMDSLTVLASLRPRSTTYTSETPPLIPQASVLRKLYRTLPVAPSKGWHGTLPASRTTALRDDSTLKIKSGTTLPVANTVSTTPITTTSATPAQTGYPGYAFNYGSATQYRPPTYPAFKGGQSGYYAAPAQQGQQQQQQQQQQNGNQAYYGVQSYGATTSQQPYSAYTWYNYPGAPNANASGSNSGPGTPQPGMVASGSYGTFFNGTNQAQGTASAQPRTPAVANTVLMNKSYQSQSQPQQGQGTWGTGAYAHAQSQGQQQVPTLPVHLRGGVAQPGTPGAYQQPPPYYGAYAQPTTSR